MREENLVAHLDGCPRRVALARLRQLGVDLPERTARQQVLETLAEIFRRRPREIVDCRAPRMRTGLYHRILEMLERVPWAFLSNDTKSGVGRGMGRRKHAFILGRTAGSAGNVGYEDTITAPNGLEYGVNDKIVKGKVKSPELQSTLEELWRLLRECARDAAPGFKYTSVQLHKDVSGASHADDRNTRAQLLVSFGDFAGGTVVAETADPFVLRRFDTRGRPTILDGRLPHWVEPSTGPRYSAVFFSLLTFPVERVLSNSPPDTNAKCDRR